MSAIRHLMRAATVAGVALTGTVVAAGPARAADASCQLVRPPTRMTVGASQAPLVGHVRSSNREILPVVQVLWRIRLSGLDQDEASLSGLRLTKSNNELRATEELESVGPLGRTISHTLRFLPGAPNGRATVTLVGMLPDNDGGVKEVCTSRATITVQGARTTPTPEATPTLEPGPVDTTPEEQVSQTPVAAAAPPPPADEGAALWPLYVLGLLLVAGGGGLVAMLLLRRPGRDNAEADPHPAYAPGWSPQPAHGPAGYGGQPAYRPAGYSGQPGYGPAGHVTQPMYGPAGYSGQPGYGPAGYATPGAAQDPWSEPPAATPPDAPTAIIPKITDTPPAS